MGGRTTRKQRQAAFAEDGKRFLLNDPKLAPTADSVLFNDCMLLQVTCRGYATAQFMQPEVASYTYHPFLAAKTFMQPEPQYYAHHPGRFFYVRDETSGRIFSAPFDPVRAEPDRFCFAPGLSDVQWVVEKDGVEVMLQVIVPRDEVVELWTATVTNRSAGKRRLSLYPYFPIGYTSWMKMAATYDEKLHGIVVTSQTPYQLMEDYFKNRDYKDLTYLLCDAAPTSWQANQEQFEGLGGLMDPDDLRRARLGRSQAHFEIPVAALQFSRTLGAGKSFKVNLVFGPAEDKREIRRIRKKYFGRNAAERAISRVDRFLRSNAGCITIETGDKVFDNFVNYWLPRQINYQVRSNRMTTDPQTRNYFQDAIGITFVNPSLAREMLRKGLSQQRADGAMPDGILLFENTELKYINRVPHRDHCVWIALATAAYVDETGDTGILDEEVAFVNSDRLASVRKHICMGLEWLLRDRSKRGLSLIGQGDWCDPMNMAGYKGKGESAWLTEALSYALQCWTPFCERRKAALYEQQAASINAVLNKYMWDGSWYARGMSDSGRCFGVKGDREGRMWLNPQSWAILCGAATGSREQQCVSAVQKHLETPFGPMTLTPGYTAMREDIGRVTQKHPGVSENGSVYSHAVLFYVFALYAAGRPEHAFKILRGLLPGPDVGSIRQTRHLPLYLPTYFRGGPFEETLGRSSHLPNTGTVSWYYRTVVERLFGLRGCAQGLLIEPQLPKHFRKARVERHFRGAVFDITYRRSSRASKTAILLDGKVLPGNLIAAPMPGKSYTIEVKLAKE
jgi:cellobionic acid phosphorylase